ncbi:MAG: DinB family protein [Phycisphaerales bacterium]|nr:DinB family protein [Phycisphaerales bacterium]
MTAPTDHPAPPQPAAYRAMGEAELVSRYRQGSAMIERRLLDCTDEQLDTFFRPEARVGQWSCRVLVGHLADAELVQAHRMRRAVAEDHPVFALWDENAFIDAGLYGAASVKVVPAAAHVAFIHTLRLWNGDWLATLSGEQWVRRGLHPEAGEQTVRDLLVKTVWHFDHHVWFLSRKLERLLGPAAERAS